MNKTQTRNAAAAALLILFTMVSWAMAQEGGEPAAKLSLWNLLTQGGWAMIPLAICSFALVTVIVINVQLVSRKKLVPPDLVASLRERAQNKDLPGLREASGAADNMFGRAVAAGFRHLDPAQPAVTKPRVEEAIAEHVSREESQVAFWINFLSLIAAISPMLGLLGTVSGMIGAFQKISQGGMGKPELLAGNIGEALVTTATGLTIAIPAMFAYFLFQNMLNRTLSVAEEQFSSLVEDMIA